MQKEWRQKTRRKQSSHYQKWLPKRIVQRNIGYIYLETEFAGEFKNFCCAEEIEYYSIMSETKAAFAERTIRSLKNILYRYMEDYVCKYIKKLPHSLVTVNSGNNRSIDMKTNNVKKSDFMSIIHSKPLGEYKNPKFGFGDRVRISEYELCFWKSFKSKYTQEFLEILPLLL